MTAMTQTRGRVLPLQIEDLHTLQAMWMPWILSGALFVPGIEDGSLGEGVFLLLLLPGMQERVAISGEVAWVNPAGGALGCGIGVRLQQNGQNEGSARSVIENCLAECDEPADSPLYLRVQAAS